MGREGGEGEREGWTARKREEGKWRGMECGMKRGGREEERVRREEKEGGEIEGDLVEGAREGGRR